jgi:hypothetical protein
MVRKPGHASRLCGAPSSARPFKDIAVITDTSKPLRRAGARLALIAIAAGLGACSHIQKLWPWHHAPAAPELATNELVVVAAKGVTAPVLAQTWDRNALRVELTGIAGEGELKLRPGQGHSWPIRLEFAVRPGSFKHLELRGEQRVVMSVPEAGAVTVLSVPQGLYAPATTELTLHYGP